MTTNHTGDGTGGFVNIYPLMVDSDSPSALLFRTVFEQLADNLKFVVDGGVSVASGVTAVIGAGGTLRVASGGIIDFDPGSFLTFGGLGGVTAGAEIIFQSTANLTFEGGSVVTHEAVSGEVYEDGAICQFEDHTDLRIVGAPFTWVSSMIPQFIFGAGDWVANTVGVYIQASVAGSDIIGFALPLLPGDQITTVAVRLSGGLGAGHAATPASPPTVELISVNNNGSVTVVASATDAVTFPAYDSAHTVTLSGAGFPYTVPAGDRVLVRVSGESGANSVADTTAILFIDGTGLANRFRNSSEMY